MIILGLDLGTNTGWAESIAGMRKVTSGTWTLATAKEIREQGKDRGSRDFDIRIKRLASNLQKQYIYDLILFEDVEFVKHRLQAQLWASFRGAVWLAPSTRFVSVPVGTLKKFATGWHTATKEQMAEALQKRYPALAKPGQGDDEVDALWLMLYGLDLTPKYEQRKSLDT